MAPDPVEGTPEYLLDEPRAVAAIDMLRRTGAADVQVRYCDEEDPVVWIAVVRHRMRGNIPVPDGPINVWEAAAGRNPVEALLRLCERLIDGGTCAHCHRPTMFLEELNPAPIPGLDKLCCRYEWDPELSTFRRACEGSPT